MLFAPQIMGLENPNPKSLCGSDSLYNKTEKKSMLIYRGGDYFPRHNWPNVASITSAVVMVPSILPMSSAARRVCSANIS